MNPRELNSSSTGSNGIQEQSAPESSLLTLIGKLVKSQQETLAYLRDTHHPAVLPMVRMEITKFDGKSENPRISIESYESLCTHNGWTTDKSKIDGLRSNLIGDAQKWYSSKLLLNTQPTWSIWRTAFINSFGKNRIAAAREADRWEYRGGDLSTYFFEKQRLSRFFFN